MLRPCSGGVVEWCVHSAQCTRGLRAASTPAARDLNEEDVGLLLLQM